MKNKKERREKRVRENIRVSFTRKENWWKEKLKKKKRKMVLFGWENSMKKWWGRKFKEK